MAKPKIFIGSSVEGLNIAYAVQQNLLHDAEVTVWDQGVFELSQTTIESLVNVLEKSDFAIFVFSPDDISKIRKKQFQIVRDNVIFELGMFIGKLGRNRSFIIMPDKPTFHIPTDLLGIIAGKYDASRSDGSYQAATGPVCHQIRIQIKRLGLLQDTNSEATAEKEIYELEEKEKVREEDWWNYYFNKNYHKAHELIEKEIESTYIEELKNELLIWKIFIEFKINPQKTKETINKKLQSDSNVQTYARMTRILLWEDELDFTGKIIEEGLAKFEKDETLISRKVEYLEKIGKFEDAISLIKEFEHLENESFPIKLVELYEKLEHKKEEAFSIIKSAYIKNPSSKELTFKFAMLARDTEKNKLALYLLDKLINKYPNVAEYWGYLGNVCLSLELNNKAMISYRKANELSNSSESWILSNIGNLLKNQGFYHDARTYFDQALAIEPNSQYSFTRVASIIKLEEEEREKYSKLLLEGLSLIVEPSKPE